MTSILDKLRSVQTTTHTNLCVGLDSTVERLPNHYSRDLRSLVDFNQRIIEATQEYCCAYKINLAFYERYGSKGVAALEETRALIPSTHLSVADAKRGDIGNTAESYAYSLFDTLNFDAVTVNPYMGFDTVEPFLAYEGKLVFVLALTSNPGSADFQYLDVQGRPLYRTVMDRALQWKAQGECGFVIGATHPAELKALRTEYPHSVFLIPGVGAQGASAIDIRDANGRGPALINSSRAILYASSQEDFAQRARDVAMLTARDLSV